MKTITNRSKQGLSIPFSTPEGGRSIFLAPRGTFNVPNGWESNTLNTLVSRKLIWMTVETPPLPPVKVDEEVKVESPPEVQEYVPLKINEKNR
tara:strand:- start:412 stop:690 length:279 start_codon:yes stop_codon:yes gene_type:complete